MEIYIRWKRMVKNEFKDVVIFLFFGVVYFFLEKEIEYFYKNRIEFIVLIIF